MKPIQKILYRLYRPFCKGLSIRFCIVIGRIKLWLEGVTYGKGLSVEGNVSTDDGSKILLGNYVKLGKNIYLGTWSRGKITVGNNSYIGRWTIILAYESVSIGNDCLIAPGCHITDVNHGTAAGELIREQQLVSKGVRIGNNVWIGAGCSILPGVTIGDGAVVGARAVVKHDVPANAIVVGIPTKIIRYRA